VVLLWSPDGRIDRGDVLTELAVIEGEKGIKPYKGRDAEAVVTAALQMYEEGKEIEEAAKELGVPARTIHRWLATNATERWHEAQKGRVSADYESARKRRDAARETLEVLQATLRDEGVNEPAERNWRLAHAREVLRAADTELDHQKWLLERLIRRIYGQQDQVADGAGRVSIVLNIGQQRSEPLDVVGEEISSPK
jgi:transposase